MSQKYDVFVGIGQSMFRVLTGVAEDSKEVNAVLQTLTEALKICEPERLSGVVPLVLADVGCEQGLNGEPIDPRKGLYLGEPEIDPEGFVACPDIALRAMGNDWP